MELDYPGVAIFYTEDGSAVTRNSPALQFRVPVHIDASKTISAPGFSSGFLPSETVALPLKKMSTAVGMPRWGFARKPIPLTRVSTNR